MIGLRIFGCDIVHAVMGWVPVSDPCSLSESCHPAPLPSFLFLLSVL